MIRTWFAIRTVDGVFIGNLFTRHAQGVGIEPNSANHKKWLVIGKTYNRNAIITYS